MDLQTPVDTSKAAVGDCESSDSAADMKKLGGFEFYNKVLGAPKYVVAPMVDQSELPWRLLSKKYNAQLCYTPMFHAALFASVPEYRAKNFTTSPEDRPLIVQFCASDAQSLLQAAKRVENSCDAVDINLGCPQNIAKRGHYGAFLMEDWDLIASMISILHKELKIPVTCKIRIFPEVEKTIRYAKMIEAAGCQLLTVHGRTRDAKGQLTGFADWDHIKAVKEAVNIPVFANGNMLYLEDVERCLKWTGCEGVMVAEANLYNPAFYSGVDYPHWKLAEEYLELCTKHRPQGFSAIRSHLFKLFRASFLLHIDLREKLAKARAFEDFVDVVNSMKERLTKVAAVNPYIQQDCDKEKTTSLDNAILSQVRAKPHWICQPFVRNVTDTLSLESHKRAAEEAATPRDAEEIKRLRSERKKRKQQHNKKYLAQHCSCKKNLFSVKCDFQNCKSCCRNAGNDCETHKTRAHVHQPRENWKPPQQADQAHQATTPSQQQAEQSKTIA